MNNHKGTRFTLHNGEFVDITNDKRPTAFDYNPSKFPIRIVECWERELLIYIQKIIMGYFIVMRLSGEKRKYYALAEKIYDDIQEVLDSNLE